MSEGEDSPGEDSSAPDEALDAKAGAKEEYLEDRVEGSENPENQEEASNYKDTNSSEYDPNSENPDHDRNNSEKSTKSSAKNYKSKSKAKGEESFKKGEEDNLEKKIGDSEGEEQQLVKALIEEGISEKEARALVSSLKASSSRKEYKHNWVSLSKYLERVKNYKNDNLKDLIKGGWYLFLALADTAPMEDPYKDIDEGASFIFLPGYLSIPRDISLFEKELGRKVAYVDTTVIEELNKIISYAKEKHGSVEVAGFSDGGKLIEDYINEYGGHLVDRFYAIAANPVRAGSGKLTHIIGDRDRLAAMEKEYTWLDNGHNGKEPEIVYGGHTYFCFDPETIKETATIINLSRPIRSYNTPRSTLNSLPTRSMVGNVNGNNLLELKSTIIL